MINNLIQKSQIIILEGERQSGKLTFALYAVKYLLQKHALIISATESKLFHRKMDAIFNRFETLQPMRRKTDIIVLKDEWRALKDQFSYTLFKAEIKRLFEETEHNVVIFHRFGLFFEFQDRFEIEGMFRTIIELAEQNNKQVIFTISTVSDNYSFMNNILCDFSDLTLELSEPNLNERAIQIVHSMHKVNQEKYVIKGFNKTLLLENGKDPLAVDKTQQVEQPAIAMKTEPTSSGKTHVLIIAKEEQQSEAYDLIRFLLANKKLFQITYVSSIYDVPQYFDLNPKLLFFFIERKEMIKEVFIDLKKRVPLSHTFIFFPQEFIRGADRRTLHKVGVDEVYSTSFQLDDLIITLEKALGHYFYEEALKNIKFNAHVFDRKAGFDSIIGSAYENGIFFSLFLFSGDNVQDSSIILGRNNDFIYHDRENKKIYYLALNTRKSIADTITYRLQEKGYSVVLEDIASALDIEKCLAM